MQVNKKRPLKSSMRLVLQKGYQNLYNVMCVVYIVQYNIHCIPLPYLLKRFMNLLFYEEATYSERKKYVSNGKFLTLNAVFRKKTSLH